MRDAASVSAARSRARTAERHRAAVTRRVLIHAERFSQRRASRPTTSIVIGSGLAGLTAANVLGRAGYRVLLLEQHYKLGGLATWFRRPGGHIFDISLHGFPHGMIKSCRRYWTQEIADSIVQLKNIRFDNPMFSLTTLFNRDDFTRLLVERFGVAGGDRAGVLHDRAGDELLRRSVDDEPRAVRQVLSRTGDVVRLLMEPITYANGSTLEDPAITYGIVFSNFMSKGVFTFEGGTDRLITLMHEELLRNGVDVAIRCDVEKILVERGQVAGVRVAGREIKAPAVISNANLLDTVLRLVGPEHFDKQFVDAGAAGAAEQLEHAGLHGLKPDEQLDESTGDLLFSSVAPAFRNRSAAESRYHEPHVFVLLSADATAGRPALPDRVEHQRAVRRLGRICRPRSTRRASRIWSRSTLDVLEKYVPNCRERIDHVEAATPEVVRALHETPGRFQFRDEVRRAGHQSRPAGAGARALSRRQRGDYHVRLAGGHQLRRDRRQ